MQLDVMGVAVVACLAQVDSRREAGPSGDLGLHILSDHLLAITKGEHAEGRVLQIAGFFHVLQLQSDRGASASTVAALGVVRQGWIWPVVVATALRPFVVIGLRATWGMRTIPARTRRYVLVLPLRRGWRHGSEGFPRRVHILPHAGLP